MYRRSCGSDFRLDEMAEVARRMVGSGRTFELLKIYKSGVLILLAGLALALLGSVRRHHLRWQAPILSLAMLALWIIWASAE